jgi:3-hydroxybutyryl-CoA dehydrogenase
VSDPGTGADGAGGEFGGAAEVERVGVLGAGTMGAGIAQLCARAGIETLLCDANPDALAAGLARIGSSLARAVERGRSTEAEAAATRERVRPAASVEELAGVELAIEVVPEIVDLKAQLLSALAALPGEPILASNTSSISIATLAERSGAPERVLGLHFFNPPTAMPLIELVATPRTDRDALGRARMLGERLGKQVVDVLDGPGFLVNRCARPFYMESLRMVEDGFAEPWEIDRACVELGGFPLGPFELMDTVGVDISLAVTKSMWEQSYGEPRWRPSPIQVAQVAAGRLGRKTGGGFYDDGDSWRSRPPRPPTKPPRSSTASSPTSSTRRPSPSPPASPPPPTWSERWSSASTTPRVPKPGSASGPAPASSRSSTTSGTPSTTPATASALAYATRRPL